MKLFIDTSRTERIRICIDETEYITDSRIGKSQRLLPFIVDTLTSLGKTLSDITEIGVHTGPGSFTGLRVGVTVADTLGFVLQIPVNGVLMAEKKYTEITYS
jgi:tRNA threonylcarbamoyl adenosine modification protein YeaZ